MENKVIIRELDKNSDNSVEVTNEILEYLNIEKENVTPLKFIFHELIANIYDHSEFEDGTVIGKYEKDSFEFIFMDDGITIPKSFENHDYSFDNDCEAIVAAVNGLSTKNELGYVERGTGLNNTTNIVINGYGGSITILSGKGLVYIDDTKVVNGELPKPLIGTKILLLVRLDEKIDIYKYLKQIKIVGIA